MAHFSRRKNGNGTTSWIAQVRRRGWPSMTRAFSTKLKAQLWASSTERQIGDGTMSASITFSELVKQGRGRHRNLSAAALAYWTEQFGSLPVSKITPALISHHRDLLLGAPTRMHGHKRTRPRAAGTVWNWLQTLSRVFSIGVKDLHVLNYNPVKDVTRPSLPPGRQRFLSDDELTALLTACRKSQTKSLYPFVLLLITTGMRRGEAYNLRWSDIDVERRWAVLPKTKNNTARGVPLTAPVLAALMTLKRKGDLVFTIDVTKGWHAAMKKAGVTNFRMHDLRHSAASFLVRDGASLVEVGRLLGHKDPRMTDRYSHLAHEQTSAMVDRVMGGVK